MDLVARALQVFEPAGPLAGAVAHYRARTGQAQMAAAVARTLENGGALVVEAGTGVGKTYAYLVPALLSGQRVLVSTATKALQDQLFGRDIPHLLGALGLALRVALLKGRASYLCLQRLDSAAQQLPADDLALQQQLQRVQLWAQGTHSGDLGEVSGLAEDAALLPWISSTRDNCLGAQCPHASACHVNLARREALAADLVVVNHHLFFADLNVRESGVAELLPSVDCAIFDEAHQLNDIGVQFLGRQLGAASLSQYARDLGAAVGQFGLGHLPWMPWAHSLERALAAPEVKDAGDAGERRFEWSAVQDQLTPRLAELAQLLAAVGAALRQVEAAAPELALLATRAQTLRETLELLTQPLGPGHLRWAERARGWTVWQAPLDIAQAMQERAWSPEQRAQSHKSWIFTSATLGHDAALSWFVARCGLDGAQVLQVPSPFDYARQAAVYVPAHLPRPADASHSGAVAALVAQSAARVGGRCLVLTTTLRAMRAIGVALQHALGPGTGLQVLVQGDGTKRALLQRFLAAHAPGNAGAVLVASASFWEGIDLPGDALQLLFIDKLPFTPPDDPVQQARARALEEKGENVFRKLHVPQAAVALKQGAGRLIRRESDRGVLVLCDVRLTQMGYGRQLLAALPPMRRLASQQEFEEALDALTRSSTTDPNSVDRP